MINHSDMDRDGFSLIELLVVIGIVAILLTLLLPALGMARRSGRSAVCQSNQHQLMIAYRAYGLDNKDTIASLAPEVYVDRYQTQARVGDHAQRLIQEGAGPPDDSNGVPAFRMESGPDLVEQFGYLALLHYLGNKLPMPITVCPEDAARRSWQSTPRGKDVSSYTPQKEWNSLNLRWRPYCSSYQMSPWACFRLRLVGWHESSRKTQTYTQGGYHDTYTYDEKGQAMFMHFSDVVMPSQKVALCDAQQRHEGKRDLFFAYADAKQPLAFFDGSVSVRKTGNANPGQDPTTGDPNTVCSFSYRPDPGFESPTRAGNESEKITGGYYRWTRGGLAGRDFGGNEAESVSHFISSDGGVAQ